MPLVRALASARQPEDVLSGRRFEVSAQWRFTLRLLEEMGFDFGAGRQDQSIQPFTGDIHPRDVRLTTRIDEGELSAALFASIHEGGHGLYEQGFSEAHHRTPLAAAPSMGLHESQSRLWENLVGRSRPFWRRFFPVLQQHFPQSLNDVTADGFYGANRVGPTLIRGQADEVTYNLHIVLRYELELLLIRDQLPPEELPREWNRRMTELLGVTPPHDTAGVLQDIHWSSGDLGYFPTYAIGNLYSAILFAALRRDVTDLDERIQRGELKIVTYWLREKIHSQGSRHDAEELVQQVCGNGLRDDEFIGYLKTKYSELYGIAL